MVSIETKRYLGFKFSVFKTQELITEIIFNIENKIQKVYFGYSLTQIPWMREKPEIFTLSDKFDIFVPDGKGFYSFLKLLGFKIGDHVSLPDLTDLLLDLANEKHYSVLLLGAEKEVNYTAVHNLRVKYPNAVICDGIDGYFSKADEASIVNQVNKLQPDILLIGITSPKKEQFVCDHRETLQTKIIVPCGGMIDVYADKTKREPEWIKNMSLAWLYRFIQEPVRLFPILKYGLFVLFYIAPICFFKVRILRQKDFSIVKYYIE